MRVAFNAVLYTKLYIVVVCRSYHFKNSIDDAIFPVLRIFVTFDERNTSLETIEVSNGYSYIFVSWKDDESKKPSTKPIERFLEATVYAIEKV